jgi:hypothetical protein
MLPSNVGLANPTGFLWELCSARWPSLLSFYQNQNAQIAMARIEGEYYKCDDIRGRKIDSSAFDLVV